jgi:hypothetical protein
MVCPNFELASNIILWELVAQQRSSCPDLDPMTFVNSSVKKILFHLFDVLAHHIQCFEACLYLLWLVATRCVVNKGIYNFLTNAGVVCCRKWPQV